MRKWPLIEPTGAVSEVEMRACHQCNPDMREAKLKRHGYDAMRVVHVILHDRAAACEQANVWARMWNSQWPDA